jgi:hypothetical protein
MDNPGEDAAIVPFSLLPSMTFVVRLPRLHLSQERGNHPEIALCFLHVCHMGSLLEDLQRRWGNRRCLVSAHVGVISPYRPTVMNVGTVISPHRLIRSQSCQLPSMMHACGPAMVS